MLVCTICHFETEMDDVVVRRGRGCICLPCYTRETVSARPLPKALRRELTALLAEPDEVR